MFRVSPLSKFNISLLFFTFRIYTLKKFSHSFVFKGILNTHFLFVVTILICRWIHLFLIAEKPYFWLNIIFKYVEYLCASKVKIICESIF